MGKKQKSLAYKLGEIIERKPSKFDFAYIAKLIRDFGVDITIEAIDKFEKSKIETKRKEKMYVGYIYNICKALVEKRNKQSPKENKILKDILKKTKAIE